MAIETWPLRFGGQGAGGRTILFRFPDADNMRDQLDRIFSGREYPLPLLPPGYRIQTVVDVGANVGAAAIWFLGAAPEARVFCFEPARENYEFLRQNLESFPKVQVIHCGLFSREVEGTLHLGRHQCMQHSLVESAETGSLTEKVSLRRASTEFDRLGLPGDGRISVLKIDTEGCEVAILRDLGPERLGRVDVLYVEWHSEEDRRAIDEMLAGGGGRFILSHAVATRPHLGSACYVEAGLAARVPEMEGRRIGRAE